MSTSPTDPRLPDVHLWIYPVGYKKESTVEKDARELIGKSHKKRRLWLIRKGRCQ